MIKNISGLVIMVVGFSLQANENNCESLTQELSTEFVQVESDKIYVRPGGSPDDRANIQNAI